MPTLSRITYSDGTYCDIHNKELAEEIDKAIGKISRNFQYNPCDGNFIKTWHCPILFTQEMQDDIANWYFSGSGTIPYATPMAAKSNTVPNLFEEMEAKKLEELNKNLDKLKEINESKPKKQETWRDRPSLL